MTGGKILQFHEDTIEVVRKLYDLENGRLNESLDLLEEWLNKQNHFTKKDFSRDFLERMLVAAKGSVEKTKQRLDRVCTYKTLMPHFFQDVDPRSFTHHGAVMSAFLPKLTRDHTRIQVTLTLGSNFSTQMYLDAYKYIIMTAEYTRANDYCSAYEIILDYRNCSVADVVAHFNLIDCRSLVTIIIEGYGVRMKRIHILTDSKFMNILIGLAKQVVPNKLKNRIYVHKTLDSLHELVEKDVLPSDLGGMERPFPEIAEEWVETMCTPENRAYWREMVSARTDESLRPKDVFNDQYLGMPGAFRTLSVD